MWIKVCIGARVVILFIFLPLLLAICLRNHLLCLYNHPSLSLGPAASLASLSIHDLLLKEAACWFLAAR